MAQGADVIFNVLQYIKGADDIKLGVKPFGVFMNCPSTRFRIPERDRKCASFIGCLDPRDVEAHTAQVMKKCASPAANF